MTDLVVGRCLDQDWFLFCGISYLLVLELFVVQVSEPVLKHNLTPAGMCLIYSLLQSRVLGLQSQRLHGVYSVD